MSYATHDLITKIHFFSSSKNRRQGSVDNLEVQQQLAMDTTAAAPDLSLHISPPSPPDDARSSGGGQANHETGVFFSKPTLCLGLVETTTTAQQDGQCDIQQQQQRLHQPSQIQRFKKSSSAALSGGTTRSGNGGSGGGKRSSRAPRMRWTTALHAHFVHAVELLGGHESTFFKNVLVCLFNFHPCSVKLLAN